MVLDFQTAERACLRTQAYRRCCTACHARRERTRAPSNYRRDWNISTRPATASCSGRRPRGVAAGGFHSEATTMSLGTILLIIFWLLILIGSLPTWPSSSGWGYSPSGGLGLVLVIVITLLLLGRI